MAVAARHADVDRAQVDPAEERMKSRDVFEDVRVDVDLEDLRVSGWLLGGAESDRRNKKEQRERSDKERAHREKSGFGQREEGGIQVF